MQKNTLRLIPSKQIIYEENFSIDQMSFNSHKSPVPNKLWESRICKLLNSPIIQSNSNSNNSNTINDNILHSINTVKIVRNNLWKSNSMSSYDKWLMSLCIEKKKSHIYAVYQEMQVSWAETRTLKRFYTQEEGWKRIQHYSSYYKHYLKYWAKPTLRSVFTNNWWHETAKQKAQVYYDWIYGNKKRNSNRMIPLSTEANEDIIFDSYIKETINNYSTTMTCESHEQGIYPRLNEKENISNCFYENFSESEIGGNGNKNSDGENNESIINIVKDMKKRWERSNSNSKSKSRGKEGTNYQELTGKYQKKASVAINKNAKHNINTASIDTKSKKISFIKISTNNTGNTKYAQNRNKTKIRTMKKQSMCLNMNANVNVNVNKTAINNSGKLTSGTMTEAAKNLKKSIISYSKSNTNPNNTGNINSNTNPNSSKPNKSGTNYSSCYKKRRLSDINTKNTIHITKINDGNSTATARNRKPTNEIISEWNNHNINRISINSNTISSNNNGNKKKIISKSKSPLKAVNKQFTAADKVRGKVIDMEKETPDLSNIPRTLKSTFTTSSHTFSKAVRHLKHNSTCKSSHFISKQYLTHGKSNSNNITNFNTIQYSNNPPNTYKDLYKKNQ